LLDHFESDPPPWLPASANHLVSSYLQSPPVLYFVSLRYAAPPKLLKECVCTIYRIALVASFGSFKIAFEPSPLVPNSLRSNFG
jgi:hypothetical protein